MISFINSFSPLSLTCSLQEAWKGHVQIKATAPTADDTHLQTLKTHAWMWRRRTNSNSLQPTPPLDTKANTCKMAQHDRNIAWAKTETSHVHVSHVSCQLAVLYVTALIHVFAAVAGVCVCIWMCSNPFQVIAALIWQFQMNRYFLDHHDTS